MGKMTDEIWAIVDEDDDGNGIISGVSYNGMTPQQAIETYEARLNAAIDAFFGQ